MNRLVAFVTAVVWAFAAILAVHVLFKYFGWSDRQFFEGWWGGCVFEAMYRRTMKGFDDMTVKA